MVLGTFILVYIHVTCMTKNKQKINKTSLSGNTHQSACADNIFIPLE